MPSFGPYETEVTFLSGVNDANQAAATSYYTYTGNVPPTYGPTSNAIKWGDATPGTGGGTVKYWFDAAANWNNTEKTIWEGAFAQWSGIANISFSLADDAAAANITIQRLPNKQAYANFNTDANVPVGSSTIVKAPASGAIVTIDTTWNGYGPLDGNSNAVGGYPYSTVIHELGHIIGLGHSGPYNGAVNARQQQFGVYDTSLWSIMSYINPGDTGTTYYGDYPVYASWGKTADGSQYQPLTPQMMDILAIQRLYGASTSDTFGGNQTFGFNSSFTGYFKSIYDFGTGNNPAAIVTLWSHGTNNALNLSGFSQNAYVDLNPGTFSSAGGKVNNIGIAFDTVVETAIGGSGNDTIRASNVASSLSGGDGNDILIGGNGADTLLGDNGNDLLQGGGGDDQLYGVAGNDTLQGGAGNDVLAGGDGDDVLDGGAGIDTLVGGPGADIFQFTAGQANGDIVTDFSGSSAGGQGDVFQFFGYGTAADGASFTKVDDTHWRVSSADGLIEDTIIIANGASIDPGDVSFHPTYSSLANSSYMDLGSWRSNATEGPSGGALAAGLKMNVALVLDRANDPSALLNMSWADRQKELKTLNDSGTLWSTYGADQTQYNNVLTELGKLGIDVVASGGGYVSSAESRTIWVEVTAENFSTLFGPQAQWMTRGSGSSESWYWTGSLSLPTALTGSGVSNLWFDTDKFHPVLANPGTASQSVTLEQGWQSPGNASTAKTSPFPGEIANTYYNFPLPAGVATGAIGLVEPGVGTALPGDNAGAGFQAAIDAYRAAAGITTSANVTLVAPGGQAYPTVTPPAFNPAGERSLDVGVVTSINPQSPLVIYAGAGPQTNAYTAYQAAFWDTANNPAVITSSFGYSPQTAPGSPFYNASRELFVDAALRNISVFNDNGDGGSGNQTGNGVTNVSTSRASPYAVMVGGTSLSTVGSAQADATLGTIVNNALGGDLATIWSLIAGGLKTSPVGTSGGAATLIETVWNRYYVDGTTISNPGGTGYIHNNTGSGGVDPSQPTPWYQAAYGLVPVTSDPSQLPGRGTPDVSANAGGNMLYKVPGADMQGLQNDDGTSAATPLWAAFASQVNTIFADQNLPQLGYMNDLLYIAAAIKPASFNDITTGNNTSSFVLGGDYTSDGQQITPTGYGYSAGPGYDLVSGLGTPNGTLLARALTEIAHHQTSYADSPGLVVANGASGWNIGATQTLLIQANTIAAGIDTKLTIGAQTIDLGAPVASQFAWTAQFAQQSLQSDFDANLVRMFDKQSQGWVGWQDATTGQAVSATIGQGQASAPQASLTSSYGIVDFSTQPFSAKNEETGVTSYVTGGTVHLARAVAVAETVGAASDQNAVVRVRQNGEDSLSLSFYKVDNLSGAIGTLNPGDAGYAAAAAGRAYGLQGGGTALQGPGYGLYAQAQITNVNSGDMIAMQLTNRSSGDTFFAFGQANGDNTAHLFNYGANTWGWEDTRGGGDYDFNDLIVQLDFTSAYGNAWLV
jgi:Ca2+-binding RTX toxin-like protein